MVSVCRRRVYLCLCVCVCDRLSDSRRMACLRVCECLRREVKTQGQMQSEVSRGMDQRARAGAVATGSAGTGQNINVSDKCTASTAGGLAVRHS